MANFRMAMALRLHELYMDPRGKSYYCMSCLDKKVDAVGSRLSSDVELLSQFGFEFFFGGVINPETGALLQLFLFCWGCYVSFGVSYQNTQSVEFSLVMLLAPVLG